MTDSGTWLPVCVKLTSWFLAHLSHVCFIACARTRGNLLFFSCLLSQLYFIGRFWCHPCICYDSGNLLFSPLFLNSGRYLPLVVFSLTTLIYFVDCCQCHPCPVTQVTTKVIVLAQLNFHILLACNSHFHWIVGINVTQVTKTHRLVSTLSHEICTNNARLSIIHDESLTISIGVPWNSSH